MIDKEIWHQWYQMCGSLRDNPNARMACADELSFMAYVLKNAAISCSQIYQDLMVLHTLDERRQGFFVDFGATDGVTLSNSNLLEKRFGWTGIVAEPNTAWHEQLFRSRSCYISTKCIFPVTGETITFNQASAPELSTIDTYSSSDFHAGSRADGRRVSVETLTLRDLLVHADAPKHIDYLSIDTEGSEYDILASFDFSKYDIDVITVEHNQSANRNLIFDLLQANGFRRKFVDFSLFDDWYVHERISVAPPEPRPQRSRLNQLLSASRKILRKSG